jgi:transcriptional regulator with XRE-family HTH domain
VESTEGEPVGDETFATVLARLMDDYGVSGSDIARAINSSPSTVSTWLHGKRVPRDEALRLLAAAYPRYSLQRLTAAAGRKAPMPASPDRKERILQLLDRMTEEQQEILEAQARAVAALNRQF